MSDDNNPIHDPANYRKLSEPFASSDEANTAVQAFFDDVRAARQKHRIADVAVLVEISVLLDGDEVRGGSSNFSGDSARTLPMLAREFGAAQQRHEDTMARIVAAGRKAGKR